jgi:hypothetical protein
MKISRVITAALCLLGLAVTPAFAQSAAAGVEVGLSMSRVSPDPPGQTIERGPGALVGGWFSVQPWVPVGIQIEAVFAQKHSHLTSSQDLKLDYIEIPMLAKIKLFKSIYMLEGVAFGFPVSAKVANGSSDTDIKDTIQSPDIGMVIAGGVPVAKKVSVEFRYEGGFKKVSNVTGAPVERNRSLSGILRIKLSS